MKSDEEKSLLTLSKNKLPRKFEVLQAEILLFKSKEELVSESTPFDRLSFENDKIIRNSPKLKKRSHLRLVVHEENLPDNVLKFQ